IERVEMQPNGIAFLYKDRGIYKGVCWKEYLKHVENFCLGLLDLGLQSRDRVAIMGDCCPEWIYSSIAVESAGAIDYGIYSTCSPDEVEFLMGNGEPVFFIAENQEYVDKLLPHIDHFPFLKNVIVIDPSGMFAYDHPKLITYGEVEKRGKKRKEKTGEDLRGCVRETTGDDIAFLIYTSGTTGFPKGVMLTHHNIMCGFVEAMSDYFPELVTHRHRSMSHLSMAHILERGISIYLPLIYDIEVHIGESVDFLQETLYEVQPTFFHGVPRIWEKMAGQVAVQIMSSSWLKRLSYKWAMSVSRNYLRLKRDGRALPLFRRVLYWLAKQMVFSPMLKNVGMRYVKYAISAGAPLPPAVQELWQTWGVDLMNVYGSTEAGGLVTVQNAGFPKPGSLGRPTSSWNKVRLSDDNEIIVSGPGVCKGYWRDEKTTKETIQDGWLYMGETGTFGEDGELYFGDRKKDIMVTSGGKNITPTAIENAIKASPFISEVVVFADGRKFPSALIEIDFNTVSEWARRCKVLYSGFTSLAIHSETYNLIKEEVIKGNQLLSRVEQVKDFRIIPKELDPEVGDTTPTRKIKRSHMYNMFKELVEEMYSLAEKEKDIIKAQLENS
ncbi:MAG: AMP-binding protein, partial [Thermodesulfobacteriota bacterium]|nr:AMP-binding protein [Thermodesulfobacteriota bacterium]